MAYDDDRCQAGKRSLAETGGFGDSYASCKRPFMGALLLVTYQLNYPFSGAARISPDAFELALQRIQGIS
jgi:hypothetical protein